MTETRDTPNNGHGQVSRIAERLEAWIATDLQQILAALRRVEPLIHCGHSHRDPRTEHRVQLARTEIGITPSAEGCGRLLLLWEGYRCVECGRWFHRGCIQEHFLRHGE